MTLHLMLAVFGRYELEAFSERASQGILLYDTKHSVDFTGNKSGSMYSSLDGCHTS